MRAFRAGVLSLVFGGGIDRIEGREGGYWGAAE